MAGEESAKVAEAYILVSARKAVDFNESIRKMAEDAGDSAGTAAGKEMADSQEEEYRKGVSRNRRRFADDGEVVGKAIGGAAASRAARDVERGINPRTTKAESSGRSIGDALGKAAAARATRELEQGVDVEKAATEIERGIQRNRGKLSASGNTLGAFIGRAAASRTQREVEQAFRGTLIKVKAASAGQSIGDALGRAAKARVEKSFDELISPGRARAQGRAAGLVLASGVEAALTFRSRFLFGGLLASATGAMKGVGHRLGLSVSSGVAEGLKTSGAIAKTEAGRIAQIMEAGSGRRAAAVSREALGKELAAAERLAAQAAKAMEGGKGSRVSGSAFGQTIKSAERFIGKIDKAGNVFSKFVGVVGGGNAVLVGAAGAIAGVVAAAGQLSGALGILPPLYVSLGLGVITAKLAFAGLDKALKDSGNAKKYAADLKGLDKGTAGFAKSLVDVKKQLTTKVPATTFAGLGPLVTKLADKDMPAVNRALLGTARGFNSVGKSTLQWLGQGAQVSKVNTLLGNTGKFARSLTGLLKPLTQGLLNFVTAGSRELPALGKGFKGVGLEIEGFSESVTRGGRNSEFNRFIQRGLAGAKNLGRALAAVGGSIGAVFGAAGFKGNKDPLGGLAAGAIRLETALSSTKGQSTLKGLFADMSKGAASVKSALPQVLSLIQELSPAIGAIVSGSGSAFGAELKVYATTLKALAPAINTVVGALAPFAGTIGALVAGFKVATIAIKGLEIAMTALDIVFAANPVGLIVIGLAALTVAFVVAWKKSEKFREVVTTVFAGLADTVLGIAGKILFVYQAMFAGLGKLPGKLGAPFRAAAKGIGAVRDKLDAMKASIDNLPRVVAVKGRIDDLEKKIATAKAKLNTVPKSKKAALLADISQLEAQATRARRDLAAIQGKTITVRTNFVAFFKDPFLRTHGGLPAGIAAPKRHAEGGQVAGSSPTPTSDNILARLTAREWVQPVAAVDHYGPAFMRAVQTRQLPKVPGFAGGGQIGAASRGMGDITASIDARTAKARAAQPPPPSGLTRDDLAVIAEMMTSSLAQAIRSQPVVLDTGAVAGAVFRAGGAF